MLFLLIGKQKIITLLLLNQIYVFLLFAFCFITMYSIIHSIHIIRGTNTLQNIFRRGVKRLETEGLQNERPLGDLIVRGRPGPDREFPKIRKRICKMEFNAE